MQNYPYENAIRPEYTCRFEWTKDTVTLWDSRMTWHYALNDYRGQRRLMHPVTLEGRLSAA